MLKYYITVLFQEFTRTLKQFFFTYLGQNQKKLKKKKKSQKPAYLFDLNN